MRNLLLSTVTTLLMMPAVSFAASGLPTHTHTDTPMELKPISLISGTKLAAVCFLGNGNCGDGGFNSGDSEYKIDTKQQCLNEGFVYTCSSGYCMDGSCPYNQTFGRCLAENCPADSATDCTGAAVGKNACGETCKQCCTQSCPSGFSDYTTANIPNGYVRDGNESCDKCGVGKVIKIKANPCSGYSTCSYGPAAGASSCLSGTTTKYSACKPCTPTCTSVSSCPGNYNMLQKSDGCGGSCSYCYCFSRTCAYWADSYTVNEITFQGRTYHNVCYSPRFWRITCNGKSSAGAGVMSSSCESLGSNNTMFCDRFE